MNLDDLIELTGNNAFLCEPCIAVFIGNGGLACLSDDLSVLLGSGQIHYIIENAVVNLVDPAVGSLDEAVLVDPCIGCQRVDKADVGTFGGLDRTHPAVVGIVNVANFEGRAVTVQTSGTKSGEPALMCKLRKRIGLIHKL